MTKLAALLFIILATSPAFSSEPVPFSINTKKWSHVLDDHFISITVNPTDLLQGKVYGLTMNSTMSILKGLAPAYVRIGSADTAKYTFRRNKYPSDVVRPDDEYTVTETHWMVFNEMVKSAGLDVIVCLNAAHRVEGTKKWDTRNSLELISFSDSQGYNLTWQLGYEVQAGDDLSGIQFGKDLNRLRTILNAFPRYQNSKLIGPDIRVIHKKEDVDFWNDVLIEAGPTLDAVTWHPRWPQPSKMKVSDNSDLGYEFPVDYLEWDRTQLNKILQRSIFKNPIWIGESKRESTGTFAEGLIWAKRLVLSAKLGIEVVMKQPNLMDVTHPKPEYWIALLHKKLLGKAVLETRSVANVTDLAIISHCTNPYYWIDKPEKLQDGPVTVYTVNMGGVEQKVQVKGVSTGRSQFLFQYVLTSGSDPDSVFSQMTYLNGEPLMMTDDGLLPDIVPKIKKVEKGLFLKLPPYSIGFWVVPEAKVKICHSQPQNLPFNNVETLTPSTSHRSSQKDLKEIENINQFIVEKLKNPESDSEEISERNIKIEVGSSESSEKEINLTKENHLPRVARKIRAVKNIEEINKELKSMVQETQDILSQPNGMNIMNKKMKLPKPFPSVERRIQNIAEGINDAMKSTNQQHEFDKFLEDAGLKQNFGSLLINERRLNAPGVLDNPKPVVDVKTRLKRSIFDENEFSDEESTENESLEESVKLPLKFGDKITLVQDEFEERNNNKKQKDLIVPHQPDLKGIEDKYKAILQMKIEDGKRKIEEIKKKVKQEEELEKAQRPKTKQNDNAGDLQKEIIIKEIELIQKAEDTVAEILDNQAKRQNTFKDIIFDELDNVKEEKIIALKEMYKNYDKNDNKIVKRQAQGSLPKPFLKTVKYMENNFDLEPENVKKIKRSLEEKMGEILRNYDIKKQAEIKKRMATTSEDGNDYEDLIEVSGSRRSERSDDYRNFQGSKDRTREKNYARKHTTSAPKSQQSSRNFRKYDSVRENSKEAMRTANKKEEPTYKNKQIAQKKGVEENFSEVKKNVEKITKSSEENFSYETLGLKKHQEMIQKYGNKKLEKNEEEKSKITTTHKDDYKQLKKIKNSSEIERKKNEQIETSKNEKIQESSNNEDEIKEVNNNFSTENVRIKNDKERREKMLKQISSMVDNFNSLEKESGRSKRMNIDEDISIEFESDKRSKKIKRKPRKAEIVDLVSPKEVKAADDKQISEKVEQMIQTTAAPVTSTTPTNKPNKSRRNRKRNRKQKTETTANAEEKPDISQKKRHLMHVELPKTFLDQEKKKLFKPKLRKINPKFIKFTSELPKETQTINQEEDLPPTVSVSQESLPQVEAKTIVTDIVAPPTEKGIENLQMETKTMEEETKTDQQPELPVVVVSDKNKELIKDLEQFVEQKRFLDQTTEILNDNLKTNGEESSEKKNFEIDFSGETPEPTEGYIVVEPTVEAKKEVEEIQDIWNNDESTLKFENIANRDTKINEEKQNKPEFGQEPKILDFQTSNYKATKKNFASSKTLQEKDFGSSESSMDSMFPSQKSNWNEEIINNDKSTQEFENSVANNHRKRRATFSNMQKQEEDEDDEDYSSEERIQKFKQMIYKTSPSRKATKNDIRPPSTGLGADEFLRMAGSTVRVVFDDVIPEAYGQTKDKIQNMGISEYIKEFGKLVQQMRNLDQIFLNIGEAAVRGYIKGNKADKGPYIQVISRKKRSIAGEDYATDQTTSLQSHSTTKYSVPEKSITEKTFTQTTTNKENMDKKTSLEVTFGSDPKRMEKTKGFITETNKGDLSRLKSENNQNETDYARTDTIEEIIPAKRGYNGSSDSNGQWYRKDVHRQPSQETKQEKEASKATGTFPMAIENFKYKTFQPESSLTNEYQIDTTEGRNTHTTLHKEIKSKIIPSKSKVNQINDVISNTNVAKPVVSNFTEEITPWIKTTEDFIQEALITLQRQKQLSDMLARGKISLKKKNSEENFEKKEIKNCEIAPTDSHVSKKRETNLQMNESLIRKLRGLTPGVYVVPTPEMTNIRSEQITNEAKEKSGLPNVVTLNIYYDKKNEDGATKIEEENSSQDPKINHDMLSYYQNKAWNSAVSQYDHNNQYVSPLGMPDLGPSMVSPLQVNPLYATEARTSGLSNSRLMQYPAANYHYPVPQKVLPPVVARTSQPVLSPVVYLQPENTFLPQPPGTKTQWRDFRLPGTGNSNSDFSSGWNLQYKTVPKRKSSTSKSPSHSYNTDFKVFSDKKRSVGNGKINAISPESPLPFWKFFAFSSPDNVKNKLEEEESAEKHESESLEAYNSSEDVNTESKKQDKEIKEKMIKISKLEETIAADKKEEEEEEDEKEEPKSRNRRSLSGADIKEHSIEMKPQNLAKRSYPYQMQFSDHDVVPQWFGRYQGIGNELEEYPQQRSQVISTSLTNEDDELLSAILNAEDELSLLGVDDDNYYYNDNALTHLRRYPRSTNNLDSAMIKTNLIYKTPMDDELSKQKMMSKTRMKNLMNEDSSLELVTKIIKNFDSTMNPLNLPEIQKFQEIQQQQQQQPEKHQPPLQLQPVNIPKSIQQQLPLQVQPQIAQNKTFLLPNNPNDDTFYFFFKYAYDSFLKMMKSMSQLF